MIPRPEAFPVAIPRDFVPSDSEGDGIDRRYDAQGTPCPGQDPRDGFRPRWGGGMRAKRGTHYHAAIDIMAAEGAIIRAPVDGFVAETWAPRAGVTAPGAGFSAKGGNYVVLLDDLGCRWYFAHLRDLPLVAPGVRVRAGDALGFNGRTGNAVRLVKRRDGTTYRRGCPHLHLAVTAPPAVRREAAAQGIEVIGTKIDPRALLERLYNVGAWRI